MTYSFITANYVARELGYTMTEGWMQGDTATQAAFSPTESFPQKFETMLRDIKGLGFTTIDLWLAHLNPDWATDEHLTVAKTLLEKREMTVNSLAGSVRTLEGLKKTCMIAQALGAEAIAGGAPVLAEDRVEAVAVLKEYGVKLGIENHPEKTPEAILRQIGDGADGHIGTALDTGWWGTQGYDAAQAIRDLKNHLIAVHMKDVKAAGAHETCALGEGIVDIKACLKALQKVGYKGVVGIEHEPEEFDPSDDIVKSHKRLQAWEEQA